MTPAEKSWPKIPHTHCTKSTQSDINRIMADQATEEDILLAKRIISAAERHDVPALKILLKEGSANVQDPTATVATSPLHAAIASCGKAEEGKEVCDDAVQTVELLLQNGAIWNDLNKEDETPGCVALRLGQKKIYDIMVEAGVRAEILFAKMEALGLGDNEAEEEEDEGDEEITEEQPAAKKQKVSEDEAKPIQETENQQVLDDVSLDNHAYLKSQLRYKPGILLDESDNAVMMDWETQIMQRHAETLIPKKGLRTMNVGHGMGIVDTAILTHEPSEHHIVEAHPQVHQRLREQGWYDKPNVHIHEGRWQDVLPKLVEQGVVLDAIYYDTFAEDYKALKEFFAEYVIQLLAKDGRFGWYNGLGADRQICYDVYTKVSLDARKSVGCKLTAG
ncbi:similar to arginine N-methyltransferase [Plenodomus lingam JN3]|uniref:Arginine N-methyltransferase 2 n=1 Tax=Leptosphaeria maculans (strain JN3 / isolate v23.1.3 / race Av1-4-5-6-7-8) TaxID=985895 RepID=E4ZP00_LEPMJ|nr:similar to arginine N-methyltransferase [Plenodomus lingam JN3]CBX93369.1 similar to arginine N-methyltransferase [Plenodomus lingam JN3]